MEQYQGVLTRTAHRTIRVESHRECTPEELQNWMSFMAENDLDEYIPEEGVELRVGSEYHSEQTANLD